MGAPKTYLPVASKVVRQTITKVAAIATVVNTFSIRLSSLPISSPLP